MLSRVFIYLLTLIWMATLLTGCLGGGGEGGNSSESNIITEITDERVSTVTLLVTDNYQRANSNSPIFLTIIARDRTDAPLTGVDVSLASISNFAVFLEPSGITEGNGRFTTVMVSSEAETFEVTATAGGKRSEPVSVTFVAPVDLIELNTEKEILSVGESATVTVKIHKEVTDDPLPNAPFNVTVTPLDSTKLSIVSETTDSNGQATFIVTGHTAETRTITVTSGNHAQTLTLYFGATLSLVPESLNALDTATLTALLKDSNNAPIANQEIKFNFEGENKETLTPIIASTRDNGTAIVTITDLAKDGGIAVVNASSGTLTAQATVRFGELLVDPRVSTVKLTIIDNFRRADGKSAITVTVAVRNEEGIPVSNVPVNLLSTSDSAFFSALSGTTTESGQFTTSVITRIAQTFEVTPTAGGVKGESVSVIFIAPTGSIGLKASEQVLSIGDNTTVTVIIRREFDIRFEEKENGEGEPLPNATFKVAASGTAILNIPEPAITNENGQATFTVTDNTAEKVAVTVTSGPITQTLPLFFGATLELLPSSINTIDTAKLTALLKDGLNKPLDGQTITFNFINKNNETLSPNTVTTKIDGTAEVIVTDLAQDGGIAVINASSGLLNAKASVSFKSNFRGNRQLAVKKTAAVLNVNQSTTITAYITDDNDLPISGQQINFSVMTTDEEMSDAQISPNSGMSDENGKVETIVSNTIAENVIVTVQADTAKQEIPLYFGANIRLTPTEIEGIADGITPVTLTAIVSDAQGVGIAGISVDVRVTNGEALLDNFRPMTDELGRAIVKVTSNTLDNAVIEAQAGDLPKALTTLTFRPSEPSTLILSTNVDSLSFNSEDVPIKAIVKDVLGNSVKDGTSVNFTTTIGIITESVLTINGIAEAHFNPNMQAGLATITATSDQLSDSFTITVQPGNAGTIEISKIDPTVIGITGSGVVQSATIEFLIKDKLGNPVSDDTLVNFSLGKTTLGGGETIMTQGESGKTATGKTKNGLVSVILNSGRVAGTIDVIATVKETISKETISTVARVIIVGGLPDADHLSLAAEFLNIAGGVTFGLEDNITAYVGDRFGNIVPDSTAVSFITEGGMIGTSIGGGAFTTTTELGQATAILQSASPTTPFLGGVPTFRAAGYECSGEYTFISESPSIPLCSNPGLVTIVAFTTGSESFVDANGTGLYDPGEPFDDLSEPYIDGNDNNIFEIGELYIDVNGNGRFDNGNNQFDGPGGEFQNTTIWSSMKILFSGHTRSKYEGLAVTPSSFSISDEGSEIFTVLNISDIYGNALAGGTRLEVTTNNGVLGGTTDLTLGDSNGLGMPPIQFTLSSNSCDIKDDEGIQTIECPPPSSATITVRVSSPFQDKDSGGNGSEELIIRGTINVK
jgi:adhesin/invasin